MIALKAPQGAEVVSFGGESYAVTDGVVQVPKEAAAYLYQFGYENLPPPKAKGKAKTETENGDA